MSGLAELTSDAGLRLKRLTPGSNEHLICPSCGGGKTREVSLSVTIDEDGLGFTGTCHRGSCGWKVGKRLPEPGADYRPASRRAPVKPSPPSREEAANRPDWLYDFFAARNIGAKTVNDFGIYATKRATEKHGHADFIVFPYRHGGALANAKYRCYPHKHPMMQERDAQPTLYNIDSVTGSTIYWVEGEPDVLAMHECGYTASVSLKDGAPNPGTKSDDKRYAALTTHQDVLSKAEKIVLAGDNDAPGRALRDELSRRLGKHRCFVVNWPNGCKDACDTLRIHGLEALREAVEGAAPYPIDGLQKVKRGMLAALRDQPPPRTLTTGTQATDDILKLPAEGRLIIVSGYPGSGKSNWTRFVMLHTAQAHGRKWAVFSPEMQPWEQFIRECAEVFIRKPFYGSAAYGSMTNEDMDHAERFLAEHVTVLASDAEDHSPTLDWILEMARIAVLRDGITDLEIDPWNELAHERPRDQTETDYIGRSLQRLKAFGLRHGINVWIVVHPTKPFGIKPGEKVAPVGPFDLAGSANWNNKADLGLTLHSPGKGRAELIVWKSRFRRWAERQAKARLDFNPVLGLYGTGTWAEDDE